jgi:hypothetical protein
LKVDNEVTQGKIKLARLRLVYDLKWLAMEELNIDKKTKGVIHRSIPMAFLPGDVDYNIKDVLG